MHEPQSSAYPAGLGDPKRRLRRRAALVGPSLRRQDPRPDREHPAHHRGLADLTRDLDGLQRRGVGRVPVTEPERGVRGDRCARTGHHCFDDRKRVIDVRTLDPVMRHGT